MTGAAGGMGRLLVGLLQADPTVELFRTDLTGPEDAGCIACDLTDAAAVMALMRRTRPERIFHLAGTMTGEFERDRAINADAARFLCEAVRALGLRSRIVVIGSSAEYGLVAPHENPVRETRALRPVTVYGLTKAFQTGIAMYYAAHHDVDVVEARPFNFLAKGLGAHLFVGRAERLIERFQRGEISTLDFGNLSSARDYVDADEAMSQLKLIADKGSKGEVYHIGSGKPTVIRDLLARLLHEAGIDPAVVRESPGRPPTLGTDVPIIYADMTKTRALADG